MFSCCKNIDSVDTNGDSGDSGRNAGGKNKKDSSIPGDWPGPGPIDLKVHDLPHDSCTIEWWYHNCHLTASNGKEYSLFSSFFRLVSDYDEEKKELHYDHALNWALVDLEKEEFRTESLLTPSSIKSISARMNDTITDTRLRRALTEVINKKNVPLPDKLMQRDPVVSKKKLHVEMDDNSFTNLKPNVYSLKLSQVKEEQGKPGSHSGSCSADLVLELQKPPIRNGVGGITPSKDGYDMFYYFIPRCSVSGTITIDGEVLQVKEEGSTGWYDHEFGCPLSQVQESDRKKAIMTYSWNWLAAQLDDGTDMTMYTLKERNAHDPKAPSKNFPQYIKQIGAKGETVTEGDFIFTEVTPEDDRWCSVVTFLRYPRKWHLSCPKLGYELDIEAAFDNQEFVSLIGDPAFWEGRVNITGTVDNGKKTITGRGFIERAGHQPAHNLNTFFGSVGEETRKSMVGVMPNMPVPYNKIRGLVAKSDRDDLMEGVQLDKYYRTLIKPIREITDRGGKSWRSYCAVASCDAVGGDAAAYLLSLCMPEMMHVGSLIVDDVQDRSSVRRGGTAAHLIYGEDIAINAGTACYFIGQNLFNFKNVTPKDQLRVYNQYFLALRAGHAGQALDLKGPIHEVPHAVETGDASKLIDCILCICKLKTAVPAGCLARMSAIMGGGTDVQVEALGHYLESIGLAFQIIDDVLNLKGFERGLKNKGEDITQGKVTIPVAFALSKLSKRDREWLWETLQTKPEEPEVVRTCIDKIQSVGGLDLCEEMSRQMVEDAWKALDPVIPDSNSKMMLRSFSWYILERHY